MDTNKHKFFMLQLLKDIFSDALLSSVLAFKGGTATMFFYNLPRFSTDLDFNLLMVSVSANSRLKFPTVCTTITMKSGTISACRCVLW